GKTTTLVQAIKALHKSEKGRILAVTPSNTAVDLISEKLSEAGLNVVRVGNPARVSARLMSLTLDSKVSAHPANREIKKLKRQASEFRDMAHKYKRSFGKSEREQRKALFTEAQKISKEVERTEQYIVDDLISKADVIAATLVGSNHYSVRSLRYHVVVIDEAGQALEPACWVPILKGRKLVLAGDHQQLPPVIKSDHQQQDGLGFTLLEKMVERYPEAVVLLEEQYRMHSAIMHYSSKIFYKEKLMAHASVASHLVFAGDEPLVFIDTAGCGYEEVKEGTSTSNPEEAAFLLRHLNEYLLQGQSSGEIASVAVISPYKRQVEVLKEQLESFPALLEKGKAVSVNTIDSFQGQERDIVYISLTRSNQANIIGFLAEVRRMNVAMTRARKKLVVIGDSATISVHPFYNDFIAYAQSIEAYHSAWEFANL
ncbi:MAG: AAA domain-containing protein, partial [Chitinophagaceae bacterium]